MTQFDPFLNIDEDFYTPIRDSDPSKCMFSTEEDAKHFRKQLFAALGVPREYLLPETELYGREYYESANYASYLERGDRYRRMVEALDRDLLRRVKMDDRKAGMLDFGCAVGFVVKAFSDLGYVATGYDVSAWAVGWGSDNLGLAGKLTTDRASLCRARPGLMTAFDVFEHMGRDEILNSIADVAPERLLVRIPLASADGGPYVLPVSERDPTHVMRLTRKSWTDLIAIAGYEWVFDVDVDGFYDTPGVMCSMFRAR